MTAAVLSSLLLAACPSDDGPYGESSADDRPGLDLIGFNGEGVGELVSPWLVNTTFFRSDANTPGSGDGSVALVQYPGTFPLSAHVDFYAPDIDTCEMRRPQGPTGEDSEIDHDAGDTPPPLISGGDTVFIDSNRQLFFAFAAERRGADVVYETDNGLDPIPSDATLNIPGDAFPPLLDYPLPNEPGVPVRLLPDSELPITSASEYSWMPDNRRGYIELEFRAYDANGAFIDTPIKCTAVDDGSFVLPADAVDAIDALPERLELRYSRVRQQIELRDDIVVVSRVIVAE